MDAIRTAATNFTHSYAAAMALSLEPNPDMTACAEAIVSHYAPHFVGFALGGPPMRLQDAYAAMDKEGEAEVVEVKKIQAKVVEKHLQRFERAGFGWMVRMKKFEVMGYSVGSAQCWITWELEPKEGSGVKPWQWTNIYGYRLPYGAGPEEKGWWEYAVSDEEIGRLLERCPGFLEL